VIGYIFTYSYNFILICSSVRSYSVSKNVLYKNYIS
jgi:hypothetical protein